MKLPIVELPAVYHVGAKPKRSGGKKRTTRASWEGSALSVSLHPAAWVRIARLGGARWWKLTRRDATPGRFVSMLDLGGNRIKVLHEAERRGLLVRKRLWRLWWRDTEIDEDVYELYDDREEAEEYFVDAKAELLDARMESYSGWVATRLLTNQVGRPSRIGRATDPALDEDLAILTVLETSGDVDGVWWDEELNPALHSAPRGGIFQSRLSDWTATEIRAN
jgi:hypothetical protein